MFRKLVNQSANLLDLLGLKSSLSPQYQCYFCHLPVSSNTLVCQGCYNDLPWLNSYCRNCAEPLPLQAHGLACALCLKKPLAFDHTRAPLKYETPLIRPVHHIKNHAEVTQLSLLTELFIDRFQQDIELDPPELLIPVPLHRWRALKRGHNPAYEWGLQLSNVLHIPINQHLCQRVLATPHQQGLSAKERRRNLRKAFTLSPNSTDALPKHIAIIDDVMTTGSTADALSKVFRKAGVKRIEVWCMARTPIYQKE